MGIHPRTPNKTRLTKARISTSKDRICRTSKCTGELQCTILKNAHSYTYKWHALHTLIHAREHTRANKKHKKTGLQFLGAVKSENVSGKENERVHQYENMHQTHAHIHTNPPTHCQMFCFVANTNTYQSFAYLFRKWGHCCMPCNPYQGYFSDTKFPRTHAHRPRCKHEHAFTLQTQPQTLTQSLSL